MSFVVARVAIANTWHKGVSKLSLKFAISTATNINNDNVVNHLLDAYVSL